MRTIHPGRLFVLCGLAFALLPAVHVMAALDAYMTIKDSKQGSFKGEAASQNIHLISVTHDAATGQSVGRRMHSPITITKNVDQASPLFFHAMSSHDTISEMTLNFSGGSRNAKTAQRITLTNATIVSIRKAGGNTEQITFDYQSIEVTWTDGGKTATDDWEVPN